MPLPRPRRGARTAVLLLAFAIGGSALAQQALGPAFTYQGELRQAGVPAQGAFDLRFRLFDAADGGNAIGATIVRSGVTVEDGLFRVALDFGPAQFAGERQWLAVEVRPAGGTTFEPLLPRTEVTAAPYAWSAATALANSVTTTSIVDGTIKAIDIDGAEVQRRVTGACQVFEAVRTINADGTVACNAIGAGSVTLVQTGAGLTGGPITGSGTLSVANGGIGSVQLADGGVKGVDIDPAQVQRRVLGTCGPGQYMQAIGPEGTVDCGTDASGPAGWSLSGNAGTNPATDFIGTTDAQAFTVRADNQRVARLEAIALTGPASGYTANVLLGSPHNEISPGVRGATISGGGVQAGDSDPDLFGEAPNQVTDHYGTVGGGYGNRAGDAAGTTNDRSWATVGGGVLNTASGGRSTVGGGDGNTASGALSTVGGGVLNTASGGRSTVGGGRQNTASDGWSTVGGGDGNTASGSLSTVGGGSFNTASGTGSTVGGGQVNTASGRSSTVGGGEVNTASGALSTVSGGFGNCAGGDLSWASGNRAKVRPASDPNDFRACDGLPSYPGGTGDEGTFAWADSQSADFVSTGPNQFLVRANGGVGINNAAIPAGIELLLSNRTTPNPNVDIFLRSSANIRGINLAMLPGTGTNPAEFRIAQYDGTSFTDRLFLAANGNFEVTANAFKPGGGSWAASSDARLKHHIEPLGGALDRLLALHGVAYEYLDPDPAKRPAGTQVGFVAQEVQQVFPDWVSTDRDGYLMVAPRGFEALTVEALRELHADNEALRAENAALRAESAELRARLEAIEARLGSPR